jgi:anaerobic ribonucleoside-triphosphate reductase
MSGKTRGFKLVPTLAPSGDIESGDVYLTSGFQPPQDYEDLFETLEVSAEFQAYATGGAILHIWLGEELSANELEKFIKAVAQNYPITYFTITPYLTVCEDCGGKFVGRKIVCPRCGGKNLTLYSRPIGYFRPVVKNPQSGDFKNAEHKFWLDARIEEFKNRKEVLKDEIEEILDRFG